MNTKHTAFKPIALSLLVSGLMYSAATQRATASDLQIYKPPEGGKATVVLMLDTSGSMEECDLSGAEPVLPAIPSGTTPSYDRVICKATIRETNKVYFYKRTGPNNNRSWFECLPNTLEIDGTSCNTPLSGQPNDINNFDNTSNSNPRYYYKNVTTTNDLGSNPDRITRLKDALFEVLNRKDDEGNYVLGENVLMGLGNYSVNGDGRRGRILVPALPLTATHRTDLLQAVAALKAQGGTPTAHAYAEAAAYLMGTTTKDVTYSGFDASADATRDGDKYKAPFQTGADAATCDGQGVYVLTDGVPNNSSASLASTLMKAALNGSDLGTSLLPLEGGASDGAWPEVGHFARRLRDKAQNPAKFKILTAVVGFGATFDDPVKGAKLVEVGGKNYYDCSTITSSQDAKNACNWGAKALYRKGTGTATTYAAANKDGSIPEGYTAENLVSGGYGQGGFYPATATEQVVQSIIDFVSDINGEIDPVPTGSIIIPQDTLAPDSLQRFAYVPALLTQPTDPVVVWRGNLKKYKVEDGTIYGNFGTNQLVFDSNGNFNKNTSDFWGSGTVADEGNVQTGGMFEKIPYKTTKEDSVERSVWVQKTGTTLTKVLPTKESLDGLEFGNYAARKILNFMGYSLSGLETDDIPPTSDITAPETPLRSLGGVVHSTPQLLTYGAEFDADGQLKPNREDYLLFGSMEGSLHLVDAGTGVEQFAFLPKTIIEKQPRALLEGTEGSLDGVTSRGKTGSPPMYYPAYGIDAPWAAYAEYTRSAGSATASSKLTASKMYAYGGLRMGGAGFYALDLTSIDDPELMFAIEEGTTGFDRLGQTWGKPVVTRIRYNGKPHLVVVISGGYDEKYEDSTFNSGSATEVKGNAVYIVSAETANDVNAGTLLLKIDSANNQEMKHSIVGRVKTLDRDSDGLTDHLYFADLGGQVFRADINNTGEDAVLTRAVRLANLAGSNPVRFYEAPTVTIHDEDGKRFAVVNVGSGDRSNPLYVQPDGADNNRIYGIIDRDVARVDLYSSVELTMNSVDINLDDLSEEPADLVAARTAMLSDNDNTRTEGWYFDLEGYGSESANIKGLKAFSEPAAIRNDLYLSVYNPNVINSTADKCAAQVMGASELHRYCLPFGVCDASKGDAFQRFALGRGIQSVNIGPGDESDTRRIIYQQPTTSVKDEITGNAAQQHSEYQTPPRLVPIRWYEKQPKLD
ncbi:MAG: PilC/PilY family type IV pilus protein [Moraxellaceae bacterium]